MKFVAVAMLALLGCKAPAENTASSDLPPVPHEESPSDTATMSAYPAAGDTTPVITAFNSFPFYKTTADSVIASLGEPADTGTSLGLFVMRYNDALAGRNVFANYIFDPQTRELVMGTYQMLFEMVGYKDCETAYDEIRLGVGTKYVNLIPRSIREKPEEGGLEVHVKDKDGRQATVAVGEDMKKAFNIGLCDFISFGSAKWADIWQDGSGNAVELQLVKGENAMSDPVRIIVRYSTPRGRQSVQNKAAEKY